MKLLLDECVPRRLKFGFAGHEILTIDEAGFKGLKNGKLIASAVSETFEVLITVDKNIQHQQNKEKLSVLSPDFIGKKQSLRITFAVDSKGFKNSRQY